MPESNFRTNQIPGMTILEIRVPRDSEVSWESTVQMLTNLRGNFGFDKYARLFRRQVPSMSFEIATINQTIKFFVILPTSLRSFFESQLVSQYPLAVSVEAENYLTEWFSQSYLMSAELVLGKPAYFPIRTMKDFDATVDPLSSVLGVMSKILPNEQILVQINLSGASSGWASAAKSLLNPPKVEGQTAVKPSNAGIIEEKIALPGFTSAIRLLVAAPTEPQAKALIDSVAGSFGSYANGDGNSLRLSRPNNRKKKKFVEAIYARTADQSPAGQVLSTKEIASLWHLPSKTLSSLQNLSWGTSVLSDSPENLPTADSPERDTINYFGRTVHKNQIKTFGIKHFDRRRHFYVVGKSGTGKSTLIANMAINDIRNGQGLAIVDPHGDLCDILLDYIPSYRVNDVIYFDPSDQTRTFVINPLEVKNEAQKELVASGIIGIFKKLFAFSWGPRLEHILRNTILTLVNVPDSSFMDVPRILTDREFRAEKLKYIDDPVLLRFWRDEIDNVQPRQLEEAIAPILNKVGQFLSSKTIRNVVGRPKSTIDIEDVMNSGKILLLNLSQGYLGEDSAALLGAMIITKFQIAAMNRVSIKEDERKDFFLYVDEFQNFATESFAKILSEARKYRLCLIMANQFMSQVPEDIRSAILGNVGSLVTFLVSAQDAPILSKEFSDIYKEPEFTSLANFQILLRLLIDGHASRPFFANTLPLPRSKTERRDKVLEQSRAKYTREISV